MRLNHNQQLHQTMRLSPQRIQSLNLIAMPIDDLREYIYEEAEKNPAIEIGREHSREPSSAHTSLHSGSSAESDAWQAFLESAPAAAESLHEHLLSQLSVLPLNDDKRRIGEAIIQNLNSRGYHNAPPETLLTVHDPLSLLTEMLHIIRRMEPQGTACTDVRESLQVQAELKNEAAAASSRPPDTDEQRARSLALLILQSHFDVLEKKRPPLICKTLNTRGIDCSQEDTVRALDFIKTLDPFPARQFEAAGSSVRFAVPEINVRRASEEEKAERGTAFIIGFINDRLPDIAISPIYEKLSEKSSDSRSRQFAHDAVREAKSFIHNLKLRMKAIYAAMEAIVKHQYDFFDKGPGNLRPLRMKDIAEEIGVHETTVSRIANEKYVQCEWGVYEIKDFFTNALRSETEEKKAAQTDEKKTSSLPPALSGSKEAVKHRLSKIIAQSEKEGGKKLSDAKLAELLAKQGITIARRTVAKYRSELNIESSFDRL